MATRWPTRILIGLGVVAMLVWSATASAQELSFSLTLDATTYGGDAYKPTNGDRGGELAIAYEMTRGLKLGGGVFLGKFDEPISDPSFHSAQRVARAGRRILHSDLAASLERFPGNPPRFAATATLQLHGTETALEASATIP